MNVALTGTSRPIHDGHRALFDAHELGDVTVGLTSDDLAPKTRHDQRHVRPFSERQSALADELAALATDRSANGRSGSSPSRPVSPRSRSSTRSSSRQRRRPAAAASTKSARSEATTRSKSKSFRTSAPRTATSSLRPGSLRAKSTNSVISRRSAPAARTPPNYQLGGRKPASRRRSFQRCWIVSRETSIDSATAVCERSSPAMSAPTYTLAAIVACLDRSSSGTVERNRACVGAPPSQVGLRRGAMSESRWVRSDAGAVHTPTAAPRDVYISLREMCGRRAGVARLRAGSQVAKGAALRTLWCRPSQVRTLSRAFSSRTTRESRECGRGFESRSERTE